MSNATGMIQKVATDRSRRAGELGTVQVTAQRSKDGELMGSWRIPVVEVSLRQGQRDLCLGSSFLFLIGDCDSLRASVVCVFQCVRWVLSLVDEVDARGLGCACPGDPKTRSIRLAMRAREGLHSVVRYGFQVRFAKRNNGNLGGRSLVSQRDRFAVDVLVCCWMDATSSYRKRRKVSGSSCLSKKKSTSNWLRTGWTRDVARPGKDKRSSYQLKEGTHIKEQGMGGLKKVGGYVTLSLLALLCSLFAGSGRP